MRLYFTGGTSPSQQQKIPSLSLGGFPSLSPIPNQGIDVLFGSISQQELREGSVITKAVVLKNETQSAVNGASIFYENTSQDAVVRYRMALVQLSIDSCGKPVMERIENGFARPNQAIFIDNKLESNALTFPEIPIGGYVGIWIERTVNAIKGSKQLECDFLFDKFSGVALNASSIITITSTNILGQYFTIDTVATKYVVWFDDGAQTLPELANSMELIRVSVSVGDTVDQIIQSVVDRLQEVIEDREEAIINTITNQITISNQVSGKIGSIYTSTDQIQGSIVQGKSSDTETIEDVKLIINY